MYKFLLCWRYLRTRYIALVSIISVTLGVATMIVVNAVMEGFTHEMQERIHGILSDIVFESHAVDGIPDANRRMAEIRQVAGNYIAGMSPTVAVPAMLSFSTGNQYVNKQVMVIGIDEKTYASVSDVGHYLQHPANRAEFAFSLRSGGFDEVDHQAHDPAKAPLRPQMREAGFAHRQAVAARYRPVVVPDSDRTPDPFQRGPTNDSSRFDPARDTHTGAVLGIGLCSYRGLDGTDRFFVLPGDDVEISYPSAGQPPRVGSALFTVVDLYESKMSEYDSSFVFVPLRKLQELRGMIDPQSQIANFNSIQIRVKEGVDLDMVRDLLRASFPPHVCSISTWRDKEGALLAAVRMETFVLNVLLFFIIAVAGFGILAIFLLIVVEKTRDIGILKSLGATGWGVLSIFLAYGVSLGVVGSGAGTVLGLAFVRYINEIADVVGRVTGRPVFDPSIYYFQRIPTIVEGWTVAFVVTGAVLIAVLASVLPAMRAAMLRPVEALRYE
jgi:lipoprotein-releasing system permease protein